MKLNIRITISLLLLSICAMAQSPEPVSRNGYWMPNSDTIRVFLVFAEATNDPRDDVRDANLWKPGQLPKNADEYFDVEFTSEQACKSRMTKYFYQASFGKYVLLGDYYPKLIQVPFNSMKGNGDEQVIEKLNAQPGNDLITANGYSINGGDFDRWKIPNGYGMPKTKGEDGYIDFILILWRVNSKITKSDNAGSVNVSKWNQTLKGKKGFMDRSRFQSKHSSGGGILQHEYSHSLYGGNNFHTAGRGAGNSTFIHAMGGWGNLSSFGSFSSTYNGWDRHRMGWQNPAKEFIISATCVSTGREVPTDFIYGEDTGCPGNEFYLDDFVDVGDMVRIKLPYLEDENPMARSQYLWLENHQKREGNQDFEAGSAKGVYGFIQVGKDDLTDFTGPGLYTTPLNGFGNFDFELDKSDNSLNIWKGKENPFTGLNLSVIPAHNKEEPNVRLRRNGDTISVFRYMILREETMYPKAVNAYGRMLPKEDFVYETHPALGTVHDAFKPGDVIAVGHNPSPTPVITWESPGANGVAPSERPKKEDNRAVILNGIRVDIVEQLRDGRVKIRLGWNGSLIEGRQRWCGPLVAYEDVVLSPGTVLRLDLGDTPQKPANPIFYRNEAIFSDTTTLRIKSGASFIAGNNTLIKLERGSKLIIEEGAGFKMGKDSKIQVQAGSQLIFEKDAQVELQSEACIDIVRAGILKDEGSSTKLAPDSKVRVSKKGTVKSVEGSELNPR